jgi:cell wall-associated NlpC family hydrolase
MEKEPDLVSYPDRARHTGCSNPTATLPPLPQPRRATEPPPELAPALVESSAGRRWTKATATLTLAAATALTCYTGGHSAHSANTAAARPVSRPAPTPTDSHLDTAHLDAGLRAALAIQARISLPDLAAARFAAPVPVPRTAHSATFRMALTPARPAAPAPTHPASAPSSGVRALSAAVTAKGTPYVWGGTSPSGFDCSGLVQWAYRKAGITLPRSSQAQSTVGTPVSESNLQPGDLVFFYRPVSHVGIYLGGGQVLHAPEPGDVVKVSPISRMPFHNARRV